MTPTPAQIKARHVEQKGYYVGSSHCDRCCDEDGDHAAWPCDASILLREVERLELEKIDCQTAIEMFDEAGIEPRFPTHASYAKTVLQKLAQAEARCVQEYLAGVEWGIKHMSRKAEWPMSWDAKFPGLKAQALIDRMKPQEGAR